MRIESGLPSEGFTLQDDAAIDAFIEDHSKGTDPVFDEIRRTLREPDVEFNLHVTGPAGQREVAFAVGPELTAALFMRPDQQPQVSAITKSSIPAVIARSVNLRPAPFSPDEPSMITPEWLRRLVETPATSASAKSGTFDSVFAENDWVMWMLMQQTTDENGDPVEYRSDIAGSPSVGWWLLRHTETGIALERQRSAIIWSMLCDTVREAK